MHDGKLESGAGILRLAPHGAAVAGNGYCLRWAGRRGFCAVFGVLLFRFLQGKRGRVGLAGFYPALTNRRLGRVLVLALGLGGTKRAA